MHSLRAGVDALVGIDARGCIVFLNNRAEELFQYSKADLLGRPAVILIPVRYRRSLTERGQKNAADPWGSFRDTGIEFSGRRKNGTEFLAEIVPDLLKTKEGKVTLLAVREHITRRNLDDQLEQAKKMEALGQFTVGIVHDFNNLLHVILGHAELALRNPQSRRFPQKSMEEIRVAAAAASSLAHHLLFYSRKGPPEPQVLNLNETIREMESVLRHLLGKHITMEFLHDQDLASVKADPSQIRQVIFNLAANARDAMPNRGRIVIETANVEIDEHSGASLSQPPPGAYVSVKVKDTGHGMDEHTRSNLFKPFFTTKAKGTGFGLSNVYGVVKQCGGAIMVTSAPMKGTTFTVYLPRVADPTKADLKPASRSTISKGETIMVVEDMTPLRKLVCKFLKSCGYKIMEARDGVVALQKIKRYSGPINLLLTDILMPTVSGPDLALRLNQKDPNARVLFMTGGTDDVIRRQVPLEEKTIVLKKPFSLDVLAQTIRKVLLEHSPSQADNSTS